MQEIWKDIVGFEGIYKVSNTRKVMNSKGNILARKHNNRDYAQICLSKDGKLHYWLLHRLVATHFIDNPEGLPQVNHKDENKENNCSDNLEWCDNMYNRHYGTGIQRATMNHDYDHIARRLSKPVNQYDMNGNFIKTWDSATIAALEITGNKRRCCKISSCVTGITKSAYGYRWKYAEVI